MTVKGFAVQKNRPETFCRYFAIVTVFVVILRTYCMPNKPAVRFFYASLAEVSILVCQHLTLVSLKVKAGKLHPAYTNCEQSLPANSAE